jgi:tetratricopeptide (TPR) repeat protein
MARARGDNDTARALWEQCLAAARARGAIPEIGWSLAGLGQLAMDRGDYPTARSLLEEGLAMQRSVDNVGAEALTLQDLAEVALAQEDIEEAQTYAEESLTLAQRIGGRWGAQWALVRLADVALAREEYGRARSLLVRSVTMDRSYGTPAYLTAILERFGSAAASPARNASDKARSSRREAAGPPRARIPGRLDTERAARLLGAAEALRQSKTVPSMPWERRQCERAVAAVRGCLGERAFAAAWAEGQAMTVQQAVEYALQESIEG